RPSNYANGNTRDRQGRLVTCEHMRRVTRTEYDGSITVLVDSFEGKRLNSPNDVVVKSDGSIWFTDPPFGILANYEGRKAEPELPGAPKQNLEKARERLKESGYDGKPIVMMQPTDLAIVVPLAPVSVQALRAIGFNVDMQSMDWQTLVGRRAKMDPPSQGGWNIFHTTWVNADMMNPLANVGVNARGKTGGWFGWAEDAQIEKLRDAYARELDPAKQKSIAAEV